MGLGYFQLTVINEEDKYLVGNPEFTYFKTLYKRHTNFAIENVVLNFSGETKMAGAVCFVNREAEQRDTFSRDRLML